MTIKINLDLCNGCGKCISVCERASINLVNNKASIIVERCNECGNCIEICPVKAITIELESEIKEKIDISNYKGVWIIGEQKNNKIHDVTFQLLSKGRELADKLNERLTVVILGYNLDDQLGLLGEFGADEVIYINSEILKNYYYEIYVDELSKLINEHKPEIVLIGATQIGRDYAPRLAKRLNTGLSSDCINLDIDIKNRNLLLQTKPAFGGNIMAVIRAPNTRPQMSTIRPGVFKIPKKIYKNAKITKIERKYNPDKLHIKILKCIKYKKKKINLEEAKIIVAGGRGVGSKENFKLIEQLANELNGEIAGSRVAVELGWIDPEYQIGQTGKTVSPDLYIACGISGAIQHRVGILNSKIIVAINKDPHADIFKIAHYGIIGDLNHVIPALIREIRKIKSQQKFQ